MDKQQIFDCIERELINLGHKLDHGNYSVVSPYVNPSLVYLMHRVNKLEEELNELKSKKFKK